MCSLVLYNIYSDNGLDKVGFEYELIDHFFPSLKKESPEAYLNRVANSVRDECLQKKHKYYNLNGIENVVVCISILCAGRRILDKKCEDYQHTIDQLKLFSGRTISLYTIVLQSPLDAKLIRKKIVKSRLKIKRLSEQEFTSCLTKLKHVKSYSFFSVLKDFAYHVTGSFSHLSGPPIHEIRNMISPCKNRLEH